MLRGFESHSHYYLEMRSIHPEIFRIGKVSRWSTDSWNLNKSSALTEATIQNILQGYLGDLFNLYVVKCGIVDNVQKDSIEVSVVFYKYIQRARLVKTRRMAMLVAAGAFESKPLIYYVRLSQGFVMPAMLVTRVQSLLQSIFGKPFVVNFLNISQLAEMRRSKAGMRIQYAINGYLRGQQKALNRSKGTRSWPPLESRLEASWINPLTIRDSYRPFKAFRNLAYFLDVLMIILYVSVYSLSGLLADVIVRGLLRNMKRHKQFLSLIETVIEYYRSFGHWPYKPLDWCIAVNGKIGSGKIRSRSYYIKTGFLPLQTISFPLEYAYRQVDTKFGSLGIKVWLRTQNI